MICLGIESTAHTFGIGIVKDRKILANVLDSYSSKTGGIVPAQASMHHVEICDKVVKEALQKAAISLGEVDVFAFSQGPGIGHCLRIGSVFARSLSLIHRKPLIGVNHCIAHLEIGSLTKAKDPVLLYVSGANTQVIAFEGGKYRVFGETLDIGCGNLLDSFARELGLGFPGGPKIAELAEQGKTFIELPYVIKGMDVSFGGILTNIKGRLRKHKNYDLCYSLRETVFAMLLEVAERAMTHCQKDELLLGGGVCCNKRLQEMARIMCRERKAKFFVPQNDLLIDNGAMIAWLGLVMHKAGVKTEDTSIKPYQRTDDVDVSWK